MGYFSTRQTITMTRPLCEKIEISGDDPGARTSTAFNYSFTHIVDRLDMDFQPTAMTAECQHGTDDDERILRTLGRQIIGQSTAGLPPKLISQPSL